MKKAAFASKLARRPVPYITLALNYYVHEYDVLGYHLVNTVIHLITGILVFYFFQTTLTLTQQHRTDSPSNRWLALAVAVIWLVHPLHIQSVTYIIQRMNSLAVMFYILAFLLYIKGRLASSRNASIIFFLGCAVSALMAFGCKETTYTLPFFIFLYEWFFLQDLQYSWLRKNMILLIIIIASGICFGLYLMDFEPVAFIAKGYGSRDFTLLERVLTELRVVVFYLSLLVWPHPVRLNFEHDFSLSRSLVAPISTLWSLVFLVIIFLLALKLARKERLISFCILWFLGNLVIESSIIGLEIIFEHRTYLPSIMLVLAAVVLAERFLVFSWAKVSAMILVTAIFSMWTFQRNAVWKDEVTLLTDSVNKSPQKARVHANLAYALEKNGKDEAAMAHYQKALSLKPSKNEKLDMIYYNYATLLQKVENYEEAAKYYYKAIELSPKAVAPRTNLAYALAGQGKQEAAVEVMRELIDMFPDNGRAHNDLGGFLLQQGKLASAEYHFKEALRLGYGPSRLNLMNIEKIRSRTNRSRSLFMQLPE